MWVDPTIEADRALIADHWEDGAVLTDEHLTSLLKVAQEQAEAYAPALAEGAEVPESYRVGVIFQARDVRRAQLATDGGETIGVGDYAIRARPLAAAVKAMFRPPRPPSHFGRRRSTGLPL